MVIAILTATTAFLWALYRLHNSGVDLNAFNPFYWLRRHKWQNQINAKPIYSIEKSMEAAALLVVAIAKLDGEITREQRQFIIQLFANEFSITASSANELYVTSSFLLNDIKNIIPEIRLILQPSKPTFKPHHITTLLNMLTQVASQEGSPTVMQDEVILEVRKQLMPAKADQSTWD